MSSTQSTERSSESRRSYSTPQRQVTRDSTEKSASPGDSTYSLLSPIYHDSFEISGDDHILDPETLADRMKNEEFRSQDCQDSGRHSKESSEQDLNLTPWEAWLLCKEKQGRIEMEKRISEESRKEEEKLKIQQKKEMKKLRAEEQHKEWVRRKQEQEIKEKEQILLEVQRQKEFEEQRKIAIREKSREKYREWLMKKKEEKQEVKRKEKEEEEKRLAEQREKKAKADKMFADWLEQSKTRPRPTSSSYGYVNGKLTGYYDGSSYPAPGFYNPIPWKPIPVPPPPKEAAKNPSRKKKKRPLSSQPYRSNLGPLYKPKDNLHVGGGMFKR
ncbi:coiled-coil domain-containing protein 34 [Pelodytes ibericus]